MEESSSDSTNYSPNDSSGVSQDSSVNLADQAHASGQSKPLAGDERFNQLDEYYSGS